MTVCCMEWMRVQSCVVNETVCGCALTCALRGSGTITLVRASRQRCRQGVEWRRWGIASPSLVCKQVARLGRMLCVNAMQALAAVRLSCRHVMLYMAIIRHCHCLDL